MSDDSRMAGSILNEDFFADDTLTVARNLLGTKLSYNGCEGIIVETEAYKNDPASHAVTRPNHGAMLKHTYGRIYIYFIYGMHYCLNFTTEKHGIGAVLIRAIEPTKNIETMKQRRQTDDLRNLTNGPGKLFQAFGFSPKLHGERVGKELKLERPANLDTFEVAVSSRIGISKAKDLPWRFFIQGNPFVSR